MHQAAQNVGKIRMKLEGICVLWCSERKIECKIMHIFVRLIAILLNMSESGNPMHMYHSLNREYESMTN